MTTPKRTLEEIARQFIAGVAEHECGAYIGSPCPTCDYRIPRMVLALREAADAARQEEWKAFRAEIDWRRSHGPGEVVWGVLDYFERWLGVRSHREPK